MEINGVMCYACSVESISKKISGPPGSWVQLGFKRQESGGVAKVIRVRLERRPFDLSRSKTHLAQVSEMESGILKNQGQRRIVEQKCVSFKSTRDSDSGLKSSLKNSSTSSKLFGASGDLGETSSSQAKSKKNAADLDDPRSILSHLLSSSESEASSLSKVKSKVPR